MHWVVHCTVFATVTLAGCATAQTSFTPGNDPRDALVMQASQAFRRGATNQILAVAPQVVGHPMAPWVDYWAIKSRLESATPDEVLAVLHRWPGTYVEDRLRNDWLLVLGKNRQWDLFAQQYPYFQMRDDPQVLCYALVIDSNSGRDVSARGREIYLQTRTAGMNEDGCNLLATQLYAQGKLAAADVWIKARTMSELNRTAGVQQAVALAAPDAGDSAAAIMTNPAGWLAGQGPRSAQAYSGALRSELATLALVRMAARDPDAALAMLRSSWAGALTGDQQGWVYGVAAKTYAQRLDPAAADLFLQASTSTTLSEDTLAWAARAAVRAASSGGGIGRWQQVVAAVDAMPATMQADPTWIYWKAIGLHNLAGRGDGRDFEQQSQAMLSTIAGFDGFYPQLASEALGRLVTLPRQPEPPTVAELASTSSITGLQRGMYAIQMGLRNEGVREWNWNLRGLNDRQMQAAAQLACDRQIWDRCVNTSERTRQIFNMAQRFPMPFEQEVLARTRQIGLDPAYAYGLIRQESRFIVSARSGVGASGLMQIMPATAQWTARKMGIPYTPALINDHQTNIALGTAYLKLALDEFDSSQALAAAAYNAGPGRPRKWRMGPTMEGAAWAENVPFSETRDYVKKVLSNASIYEALITSKPQSLRARLGQIGPRPATETDPVPDMP